MNLFFREMKAHRKSLIIWCIVVLYLVAAGMWKFQTAYSANQSLSDLIHQLPEAVRVLLGIRGALDLSTVAGYYGMLYYYIVVMAVVFSSLLGAGIIAKEELDKTSEFLFAKPVSRNHVISIKLLAGLANIFVFNMVALISSLVVVNSFKPGGSITGEIITLMIGLFLLQCIFLLIGTSLSAIGKNPKSATSKVLIVLLMTLLLAKGIDMSPNLLFLKYLTPIKYFEAEQLLLNGGFDPVFMVLTALIIIALLCATYVFYKKRDLRV